MKSELFRLNQVGYAAGLPVHIAVLTGEPLVLKDGSGKVIPCPVPAPREDRASGDSVCVVNLGVLPEGSYTLSAGGETRRLTVSARPWTEITDALCKALYYQRCGCGLTEKCAGVYAHPPCHTAEAADWENRSLRRKVPGGWHDAGDYGKYVVPGAVTAAHLLYARQLFPGGCSRILNIPESGNGVEDLLNEVRFELEWILRMQREDGAFHHKLTKDHFAPFIMPQEDTDPEYLMPVSHCATADACACLALASRTWREIDASFADEMLSAAARAWRWLEEHPDFVPFTNPEGVHTGGYGDRSDLDERFWAACEMFAATGGESFRAAAEALLPGRNWASFGWADVSGLGALCCLFTLGEKAGPLLCGRLREEFLARAEEILALLRASGYGTALGADQYHWGSILSVLGNAMALIAAFLLTRRTEFRDGALLQWNYALGMNALDLCFVTGFGERTVLHPHHRPSAADGVDAPVPGMISGGPNKSFPYPMTREKLGPDMPPARCFLDETFSADTNEIAIYWNSPAVFVGAFLNTCR